MRSGVCRMIGRVICQCVSVFCKWQSRSLFSSRLTKQSRKGIFTIFLDLLHKPNIPDCDPIGLVLWVSNIPTVQILDYCTATLDWTNLDTKLQSTENFIGRYQDSTNTWRPQTSVFWREITVHQYSTTTSSRLHRDSHYDLYCQTTTTYRRHHGPT